MAKRSEKIRQGGNETTAQGVSAAQSVPWSGRDWLWAGILVAAVVLTYGPVQDAGFIWDDDQQLQGNRNLVGLHGLKDIWTTNAARFFPLTLTTFWVEHALWGLNPLPYHLVNVFQHAACAVVLWLVLRSLRIPGAWLGAALWALHPVEVESVAWVAEMKNTQSGLFFLLSILFFIRWLRGNEVEGQREWDRDYTLTLLFAAMAMLSKSSTVILPLVLCLCAWWVEGKWNWRNLTRAVPVFLISVATSLQSVRAVQVEGIADPSQWALSWPVRLATAGDAVWFYLGKLIWPYPLIAVYPRWKIDPTQCFSYLPLVLGIVVLLILWWKRHEWGRPYFFALVYFIVALLPVLGLVYHNFLHYGSVADHFQYLASMGFLALAGAGVVQLAEFMGPENRWLRRGIYGGLLLVLAVVSSERVAVYKDQETLWTDTLAKNPDCWNAYVNLGGIMIQKGRIHEGLYMSEKAINLEPDSLNAHNNLGIAFVAEGKLDEAIAEFGQALKIDPTYDLAHNSLGSALLQKGEVDESIGQFRQFVRMQPNSAMGHGNLGSALLEKGEVAEAISEFKEALRLDPHYAHAQEKLAKAEAMQGEGSEGK